MLPHFEKIAPRLFIPPRSVTNGQQERFIFPEFGSVEEEPGYGVWAETRLNRIREVLKAHGVTSLLDVGCGDGSQATIALARDGLKILGLEPVLARAQKLSKAGVSAIAADLPAYICCGGTAVPNVLMLDVLQYTKDDRETLYLLKSLILPGGKLVITVPCYSFLYSNYDREIGNLRRYNPRQFLKLMSASGFSLDYKEFLYSFLLPGVVLRKLIRRKAIKHSVRFSEVLNKFSWLVGILSAAEQRVRPPVGVTLLCVFSPKSTKHSET